MLRLTVSLALLATLISCSKDDDKNDTGGAAASSSNTLSATDLAPPAKLKVMTASEAKATLSAQLFTDYSATLLLKNLKPMLLDEAPDGEPEPETADEPETTTESMYEFQSALTKCLLTGYEQLVGKVVGQALVFESSVDHSNCFKTAAAKIEGLTLTVVAASTTSYTSFECAGWDPKPFAGKTFTDLGEDEVECKGTGTAMSSSKQVMNYTIVSEGTTIKVDQQSIHSSATADNKPCTYTLNGTKRMKDGCVTITKEVDGVEADANIYVKLTADKLVQEDDSESEIFDSGSYKVELNGWTGKITYQGTAGDPSFTLTNGTVTESGTFSPGVGETGCLTDCSPVE
jgi:hypothetical protein